MIGKISAIVLLATSVACATIGNYEPCSQLDQLIPDPKNCSRFYECTLGGWVGEACNPGLEFNPATLQCDYPQNVKCANETNENGVKLEPCTELDQLIPDPKNCSRFYECTLVGWVGLFCYPGLYFNPATSQCDYSWNVQCENDIPAEVPRSEPTPTPTLEPCTVVDQLKPDVKNCSRFYECTAAGWWVGEPCSVGLLFNPDTLLCDYPENVICATEGPSCGPQNIDELFPDASDCKKFLQCSDLGLVSMDCPGDLLFNRETLMCDYSLNVAC